MKDKVKESRLKAIKEFVRKKASKLVIYKEKEPMIQTDTMDTFIEKMSTDA